MNFSFNSRVLVIGITEPLGSVYTALMKAYGTQIVAGVSPGYGGQTVYGIPVYNMVEQALDQWGSVETAVIFVPPYEVRDAALEAIASGIRQLVLIPEGVPPLDMVALLRQAELTETLVIGANSPGVIVPGQILVGTHPPAFYTPGPVGIVSRSGTLTYEVALELTRAGLGQSIAVGVGSDRIIGSSLQQWLQILEEDDQTDVIVLIGEAGGDSEALAARYIAEAIDKPVVAYIAGRAASKQSIRQTGATAECLSGMGQDAIADSRTVFWQARIPLAERPSQIANLVKQTLRAVRL
ncbi:CoA-binding protein [Phormidium tenue FACHB-886]|nr:CoA-binding protein [Phormidium tenue FACHB-886]